MGNFLENMFGKIGADMCKLSMNGDIAIKTSSGYKTYNIKTNKLTNCSNFVFNMGNMDCFFLIPTNKVAKGDIIIANKQPKCVIKVNEDKSIKVINYETSVVEEILPERHVFMGNTYFYGKIVSMFGNLKTGGSEKIFKYMMMSEMMKGVGGNGSSTDFANIMPMMLMMNNGEDNIFTDMFDIMNGKDTENTESEVNINNVDNVDNVDKERD